MEKAISTYIVLLICFQCFLEGATQKKYKWKVSSKITDLMDPKSLMMKNSSRTMLAHVPPIELHEFLIKKVREKGLTKDHATFSIRISRNSCPGLKLCFGNDTVMQKHLSLMEIKNKRDMQIEIAEAIKYKEYLVDACEKMTIVEWEFPKKWEWRPYSEKGKIHFSHYQQKQKTIVHTPARQSSKATRISNEEIITFYQFNAGKGGILIRHGPESRAFTTLYETTNLLEAQGRHFYVVLAQDPQKCGARLQVPTSFNREMAILRKRVCGFSPSQQVRIRKGTNVWALSLGFFTGSMIGLLATTMVLCKNSKTLYKNWNDEMKKTYGKFALTDGNTSVMGTVTEMGAVSTMSTVSNIAGAPSTMSTIGGDGASTMSKM